MERQRHGGDKTKTTTERASHNDANETQTCSDEQGKQQGEKGC